MSSRPRRGPRKAAALSFSAVPPPPPPASSLRETPPLPTTTPQLYGTLSILPPEVLYLLLSTLPTPTVYNTLRFLSRPFRALTKTHFERRWLAFLHTNNPICLADDLRAIQLSARADPLHSEYWASPHFITHRNETQFYPELERAEAPCDNAPNVDISAPLAVARILKLLEFDVNSLGNLGFLMELAARLYSCNFVQVADAAAYTSAMTRMRYRDAVLSFLAQFDADYTAPTMRALLELARGYWSPDGSHLHRRRSDDAAGPLSAFLKRFPVFAKAEGGKRLLWLMDRLRDCREFFQFTADTYWVVLATVQDWKVDGELKGRFKQVFDDEKGVAPETVSKMIQNIGMAGGEVIPGLGGDDGGAFAKSREVLKQIVARELFPAGVKGGFARLAPVIYYVAEIGLGYRRNGIGQQRSADMVAETVAPCLPLGADGAAEMRVCNGAVFATVFGSTNRVLTRVHGGPGRAFGIYVARMLDIYAGEKDEKRLSKWEASELFDRLFTAGTIFHTFTSTPKYALLVDLWRTCKAGGEAWVKADFAEWRQLVFEVPMGERKEARRRMKEVEALLLNVQKKKRPVKVKEEPREEPLGVRRSSRKKS